MARLYGQLCNTPFFQPYFQWQRYIKSSRLSRVLRNFFLAGNQYFVNVTLTISLVIVNLRVIISQEIGR